MSYKPQRSYGKGARWSLLVAMPWFTSSDIILLQYGGSRSSFLVHRVRCPNICMRVQRNFCVDVVEHQTIQPINETEFSVENKRPNWFPEVGREMLPFVWRKIRYRCHSLRVEWMCQGSFTSVLSHRNIKEKSFCLLNYCRNLNFLLLELQNDKLPFSTFKTI